MTFVVSFVFFLSRGTLISIDMGTSIFVLLAGTTLVLVVPKPCSAIGVFQQGPHQAIVEQDVRISASSTLLEANAADGAENAGSRQDGTTSTQDET